MKQSGRGKNFGGKARKPSRRIPPSQYKTGDIQFNVTDAELKRIAKTRVETASGFAPNLADREKRLGAYAIDLFPIVLERVVLNPSSDRYPLLFLGSFTFLMLIWTIIDLVLYFKRGQTIGKYFMKIQILDYETREIPSFTTLVFIRPIFYFLMVLPRVFTDRTFRMIFTIPLFLLVLTDYFFIFKKDRRCLHDRIAGTMVVNYETVGE